MYQYHATIKEWHDGDTCSVDVDLGFCVTLSTKIRLAGIDTPEINSADPKKKAAAIKARDFADKTVPPGTVVVIESKKSDPRDKYQRFLADIPVGDTTLSDMMIKLGLGVSYDGGARVVSSAVWGGTVLTCARRAPEQKVAEAFFYRGPQDRPGLREFGGKKVIERSGGWLAALVIDGFKPILDNSYVVRERGHYYDVYTPEEFAKAYEVL